MRDASKPSTFCVCDGSAEESSEALSYVKDQRNTYGEYDEISRKNIRCNKLFPTCADRHWEHQVLSTAALDAEQARMVKVDSVGLTPSTATPRSR